MTFAGAMAAIIRGDRVRRPTWSPPGGYWYLHPESKCVVSSSGQDVGFLHADNVAAGDWEIVPCKLDELAASRCVGAPQGEHRAYRNGLIDGVLESCRALRVRGESTETLERDLLWGPGLRLPPT